MTILIDANIFCAYYNKREVHHTQARRILEEAFAGKHGNVITTDYVFDETVNVVLRKLDKKSAAELGLFILNSEIRIGAVGTLVFTPAWDLFVKNNRLSFTDCTSIVFMNLLKINKIATFDKAFKTIKQIEVIDS